MEARLRVLTGRRVAVVLAAGAFAAVTASLAGAAEPPPAEAFVVVEHPPAPGARITPLLSHQLERAWQQDAARRAVLEAVRTEADVRRLQAETRRKALEIIGGLPETRTPLGARIVGTLSMEGYRVEKLVFESLPGLFVTALVYVPDAPAGRKPAVLVACGHSPLGKAYPRYQEIAARLVRRGYVVLCWDPVGQGERSQFWDSARARSRYNLVCGEHAVLGNLATLAGASLVRWMAWDGVRAVDYLLTRPDVDGARLAITGTSGGGGQSTWIFALDERIGVGAPSCFVTSLPMRMANRIFEDPDSDPEQDPPGLVSAGVDHAGLLLLAYPRPIHVSAAVKDFVPIEGTRMTVRAIADVYRRLGLGDRVILSEGFHEHRYSDENQESAFDFIDRFLGLPRRAGFAPVRTLGAEALRCTASGQVRVDLRGRSLPEVILEYYRERGDRTGVRLKSLYFGQSYPGVRDWPLVPYDGAPPGPAIAWERTGGTEREGVAIDRYLLHHGARLAIPLLHIYRPSSRSNRMALDVGLAGKIGRSDWPVAEAHLAAGREVVSFDPRGLGETRMRYKAVSIDDPELAALDEDPAYASPLSGVLENYVYNSLLTGRPYFLEMIEDAEIASRFARLRLGAQALMVAGRGEARALAAAAAEVLPGLEAFDSEGAFSWAETVEGMRETWPIHFLLPGGAYLRANQRPGRESSR
jgi:dienelactone hydrolase